MIMTPYLRKFALTMHITSSVGWIGAVAAFLALAVTGLSGRDAQVVRAAYMAMAPITWFVIIPLAFASLLTGLLLLLGAKWGLFRHYWILVKFLINILSIIILLLHTRIICQVASAAAKTTFSSADLRGPGIRLVVASIAALVALLVATTLSVYKPRGMAPPSFPLFIKK
jgi:hypothetical protein